MTELTFKKGDKVRLKKSYLADMRNVSASFKRAVSGTLIVYGVKDGLIYASVDGTRGSYCVVAHARNFYKV